MDAGPELFFSAHPMTPPSTQSSDLVAHTQQSDLLKKEANVASY